MHLQPIKKYLIFEKMNFTEQFFERVVLIPFSSSFLKKKILDLLLKYLTILNDKKIKNILVKKNIDIKTVLSKLDKNQIKMLCYINNRNELIGVINDGDIRRAILKYQNLDFNILNIINKRPIVGKKNISDIDAFRLMKKNKIDYLPILDGKKF